MRLQAVLRRSLPHLVLAALSFAFRAPALLNAAATNSDAAVVGLQAMHILRGEWSPFLFGSGYQTSSDSCVAALFFAVFGPTPLALMLSSLSLHTVATLLAFAMLRRHTRASIALLAALTLVFTTSCLHSYALYPPRQLSLTLAMLSAFLLDDARSRARLFSGSLVALLAWVSDPYALVLLPGLATLAAFRVARSEDPRRAAVAALRGALTGAIPLVLLFSHPQASHGVTSMGLDVIGHNAKLLYDECFPWMIGTAVWAPVHWMDYARVDDGAALHAFRVASVAIAFGAVIYGKWRMWKDLSHPLAPLMAMALVTVAVTLAGFLVSHMVMDHFSMRYLAAIALVSPMLLAPALSSLDAPRAALWIAPYLVTTALGGWLGYGPYVEGPFVVITPSARMNDERDLVVALEALGVREATADYWSAYRLTFLSRERVAFVPLHVEQDRYAPMRARYDAAEKVAYVYDDLRSFEDRSSAQRDFEATGTVTDRLDFGVFHAIVVERGLTK